MHADTLILDCGRAFIYLLNCAKFRCSYNFFKITRVYFFYDPTIKLDFCLLREIEHFPAENAKVITVVLETFFTVFNIRTERQQYIHESDMTVVQYT